MKIRGFISILLPAAALILSGCATTDFVTGMTPEQIQAHPEIYQQRLAQAYNQPYQAPQMPVVIIPQTQAPVVNPIGSQDQTVVAYCNQTSSYTTNCRIK